MIIVNAKSFEKKLAKIKDTSTRIHISKQIKKIIENPGIGKPMRYARKGTREVYISPFRLSYCYESDILTFLDIYHKDEQ